MGPDSAAPISISVLTGFSISGGVLSASRFRMIATATGEASFPLTYLPSSGGKIRMWSDF
jgi:hypothetical protein